MSRTYRTLLRLGLVNVVFWAMISNVTAQAPPDLSGSVTVTASSAAVGIGWSWGKGTLTLLNGKQSQYKGMMLPVTKTELNLVTLEAVSGAGGTSNTLLIGESIDGANYITARDVAFPWISSGFRVTFFCIPSSLQYVTWADFSSKHSGMMVNFAMGDGSVRSMRPMGRDEFSPEGGVFPHNPLTTAERAFWAMSGFADGDMTTADGVNK
jgi:prepilin-type processing-associated H-X9-DG protein